MIPSYPAICALVALPEPLVMLPPAVRYMPEPEVPWTVPRLTIVAALPMALIAVAAEVMTPPTPLPPAAARYIPGPEEPRTVPRLTIVAALPVALIAVAAVVMI